MKFNRRSFIESLAAVFSMGAGAVALEVAAEAPKSELIAKALAVPAKGVLVIEFDATQFPHRHDGAYHGAVVGAVSRIANGREILNVAGQCIFPVYGANGSVSRMAQLVLVPEEFGGDDWSFGDAPKVRWLGGDKFERVA